MACKMFQKEEKHLETSSFHVLFGGDYGARTCDLTRVKRRGAVPHGRRSDQQQFSTIFNTILEKAELSCVILF